MTAPLPEQLRTFHITGHGLEDAVPALTFDAVAAGRTIPEEGSAYPIRIGPHIAVPFTDAAAADLPLAALLEARQTLRKAFLSRLRQTADRVAELLALDDSHSSDAVSAASVTSALGAAAAQFLNMASLAGALRRRTNPVQRMAPERRERCEQTLITLRAAIARAEKEPAVRLFLLHPPESPLEGELHTSADPCALALADTQAELGLAETAFRALRVAQLDLDEAYDATTHDAILARFHWQAAHPAEIASLPPAVVLMTTAEAAQLPISSFTALLRSGCPIQLILTEAALSTGAVATTTTDFAQLAISLRDPFVLQSSLAFPDHLRRGCQAMAQLVGPALAVIATPAAGGWAESAILVLSKAWPLLTFQPGSNRWRDRLQLQPIEPNSWTAAHAAALDPKLRFHFRTMPEMTGDHDPVELDKYLAQYRERAPLAIPYFTTTDGTRIAVSREMAAYCHDRMEARAVLEEWTAAPAVQRAAAEPLSSEVKEQAMRQGAELAVARAIALLTGTQQ